MNKLLRLAKYILYYLEKVWPRNNKVIVFSGFKGETYADNTRYLFKNFIKNYNSSLRIVWLTSDKEIVSRVAEETSKNNVFYIYSLKAIYYYLVGNIFFITHSSKDFVIFPMNNKIIYNLWHGIPLKTLRFKNKKFDQESIHKSKNLNESGLYNYLTGSSDLEKSLLADCFNIDENNIKVTGMPKNDHLFQKIYKDEMKNKFSYLQKKVILYAPTFRENDEQVNLFPFEDYKFKEISELLLREDIYLLIRSHNFDNRKGNYSYENVLLNNDHIIIADQQVFPDVNDLLPFVDILVTDYSSVYFDFLILNRPIIFIPYDLSKYEQNRGLLFDYNSVTPGDKVRNQREFLSVIEKLISGQDKWEMEREIIKNKFHKYQDGLAHKRIFNIINKHIY